MRTLLIAGALALAVSFIPRPAMAAMCGPSKDVFDVENGTIYFFNAGLHKGQKRINNTYIMAVVVFGTYAQVDISYAGQMSDFWIKKNGTWTLAGSQMPRRWPAAIRAKLTAMSNARAGGSKQCTNPRFVPRGSGG
ncbi:MAG TPA: hypothetical protein VFW34_11110 [Candidatus Rubrimentiphilum sp.]|nr:hypothetical protein [Candidatus Rubrimentiphilum sp.]